MTDTGDKSAIGNLSGCRIPMGLPEGQRFPDGEILLRGRIALAAFPGWPLAVPGLRTGARPAPRIAPPAGKLLASGTAPRSSLYHPRRKEEPLETQAKGRPDEKPPCQKQQLVHSKKTTMGGEKKFSFQIIEPTVVKTSRLICMTCSMHSTLINWWNILHS